MLITNRKFLIVAALLLFLVYQGVNIEKAHVGVTQDLQDDLFDSAYNEYYNGDSGSETGLDPLTQGGSNGGVRRPSLLLPRPYLFIHIPKSGGTSVGRLAELPENGGGDRFIRYWHHPTRPEVIQEMVQHDFVFGHFKYGVHEHFAPVNCTYLTILRDPVERVISHYYYHLKSEGDRYHHLAASNSLEKWVTVSVDANNDQVQFLSGKHGIPGEEEFQMAMENLKKVGFVGIYEEFDETMVMLKHFAGFETVFYNHTKSVLGRPKSQDLAPSVIESIKRYVQYDLALYKEGKRIFEAQKRKIGRIRLKMEVDQFRKDLAEYHQRLNASCVECFSTSGN